MANRNRKADSARPLPVQAKAKKLERPAAPPPVPASSPVPDAGAHAAELPEPAAVSPESAAAPLSAHPLPAGPLHPDYEYILRSRRECIIRFAQRVRAVRLQRGITQDELSFRAKIHRPQLGLIETARRASRLDMICKIAAGLQVSPAELMPQDPTG